MRIPIPTNLKIDEFVGGSIVIADSMVINGVYEKRPDGTWSVVQRPAVNVAEDPIDSSVTDVRGRGSYDWAAVDALYFVNNDTVYKGDYGTPCTGNITAGTGKVYIFELGDYLVILDPDNNEGWYINSATSTTVTAISDLDFPPNQTPALNLAKGGAVVNGVLYVPTEEGQVYGCESLNPTSWVATNVLSAEYEPDDIVLLFEQGTNIAVCGSRTIEFFYDAANPTGSALRPRTDIQLTIGAANQHSFWSDNNNSFFLGLSQTGEIGAYVMVDTAIRKVSTTDIDSFLTSTVTTENKSVVCSGFAIGGRVFYLVTTYQVVTDPSSITTLAYDLTTDTWAVWDLQQVADCPVVDFTKSTRTKIGKGILLDGKIITIADDYVPNDRTLASGWVQDGWVEEGWVSSQSTDGTPIDVEIIFGRNDLGIRDRKFVSSYRIVAKPTGTSQTASLSWSDCADNSYITPRNLDLSLPGQRLSRCGAFRSRNMKLTHSSSERVPIDGIEVELEAGTS